jgi:hypothetical protein
MGRSTLEDNRLLCRKVVSQEGGNILISDSRNRQQSTVMPFQCSQLVGSYAATSLSHQAFGHAPAHAVLHEPEGIEPPLVSATEWRMHGNGHRVSLPLGDHTRMAPRNEPR